MATIGHRCSLVEGAWQLMGVVEDGTFSVRTRVFTSQGKVTANHRSVTFKAPADGGTVVVSCACGFSAEVLLSPQHSDAKISV